MSSSSEHKETHVARLLKSEQNLQDENKKLKKRMKEMLEANRKLQKELEEAKGLPTNEEEKQRRAKIEDKLRRLEDDDEACFEPTSLNEAFHSHRLTWSTCEEFAGDVGRGRCVPIYIYGDDYFSEEESEDESEDESGASDLCCIECEKWFKKDSEEHDNCILVNDGEDLLCVDCTDKEISDL